MNRYKLLAVVCVSICLAFGPTGSSSSSPATLPLDMTGAGLGVAHGAHIVPTYNYGSEINAFNNLVGKKLAIVMYFVDWSTAFTPGLLIQIRSQLPSSDWPVVMLTWEPHHGKASLGCNQDYDAIPLDNITAGYCDTYIRNYAKAMKARPERFLMRMGHEMNTTDYPWSGWNNDRDASKYVNMFRHVRQIFTNESVSNVEWLWSPNYASNPGADWNNIHNYYPGDAYVDWIGLSGYNWYSSRGVPWKDFSAIYDGVLRDLGCRYAKPQIIAEIGSINGTSPTKADWILDAYQKMPNYPFLRAVVWFNNYAGGNPADADFRVTTYTNSWNSGDPTNVNPLPAGTGAWTQAYQTAVSSSVFVSTLPPLVSATPVITYCGPIPPPNPIPGLTSPGFLLARPGDPIRTGVSLQDITTTVTLGLSGLPVTYTYSFTPSTFVTFTSFPSISYTLMTINVPASAVTSNLTLTVYATGTGLSISDTTTLLIRNTLYFAYLPVVLRQ